MSIITYAQFTTARANAAPGKSLKEQPPGVSTFVDALAALIPAEVLTMHGVILSVTTSTTNGTITITAAPTLQWSFFGLIGMSLILYVGTRRITGKWDRLDWLRMLIPPTAFVAWTMLQRATAFDAVYPTMSDAPRTVIALFVSVLLGLAASALAYRADQQTS